MIYRIILLVLALFLLTACTGTREKSASTAYDPCRQMRTDADEVTGLEGQVRDLRKRAYPEPSEHSMPDAEKTAKAESLLVQKENLLSMAVRSMQQSAQDCAIRSRPSDLDRTVL